MIFFAPSEIVKGSVSVLISIFCAKSYHTCSYFNEENA